MLALPTLAACGGSEASGTENGDAAAERRAVSVEVLRVQPEAFTETIRVVGTVEANRDVTVSAEESGTIRAMPAARGALLAAGDAIARIDDEVLRAEADQAAAEARLAEETYERRRRLWEDDGVGTELAVSEARAQAETSAARLRSLQTRLNRTVIRAPFVGTIESREVDVGSSVSAGTAVARLVDIRTVKVAAGVPERYTGDVHAGGDVRVTLNERGGDYAGTLAFVGSAVQEDARTFPIEVDVPNPEGRLRPGMSANVRLPRRTLEDALLIPQEAMMRDEDGYVVYVVVGNAADDGTAARRMVRPGPTQTGRVVIESGLSDGDRVIVVGQQRVADGEPVRVVAEVDG